MAITLVEYANVGSFNQTGTTETQRIRWDAGTDFTADDTLLMLFHWNMRNFVSNTSNRAAVAETELDAADQGIGNDAESRFDWSERNGGSQGYLNKHGGKWFSEPVNSYVEVKTYGSHASADSRFVNMVGLGINITDLEGDSTQYLRSTTDHANTNVSTSWGTDLETLTVTPNEASEVWLIIGHFTCRVGSNETIEGRLLDNADTVVQDFAFHNYAVVGTDDYTTIPFMYVWTAPDTEAETFAIQGKADVVGLEKFVSHLTAVRLKSISDNFVHHAPSDYTLVTGDAQEDTGGTASITGGGNDIVMLAMCKNAQATTQDGMNIWATKDSNTNPLPAGYQRWNGDLTDPHHSDDATSNCPVVYVGHEAAVSGARTYELYGSAETAGAIFTDITFLAFELDGGDGGPAGGGGAGTASGALNAHVSPAGRIMRTGS